MSSEDSAQPSLPLGAPASGRLHFRALRNGSPLGEHEIRFVRQDDRLIVDIAVDYVVKIAFVTAFKYKLRAREIWRNGELAFVRAKTDNNGRADFMSLDRIGDQHVIDGSRARALRVPSSHLPAFHWNKAQLRAPMISPQDGSELKYAVSMRGESDVLDAAGRKRRAEHFLLADEQPLELWYDRDQVWVGLRARVFDGSRIEYRATV